VSRAPDAIAPDGSEVYFVVSHATQASLVEVVLRPGGVSRPVRHRTVEEIWYFLAGEGEVWVADRTFSVKAGATVVIPGGMPFQFRCIGSEPLRFLCFTSPPWPGGDEAVPAESGGLGEPTV
jgi:mannose-6-phosphate isomerase-like protein (cupin superfamily)